MSLSTDEKLNGYTSNIGVTMPQRTIQRGDTLTQLAKGTGYTVDELAAYNQMTDPNKLRVGQDFFIPYSRQEFEAFAGPMGGQVSSPTVAASSTSAMNATATPSTVQTTIPWSATEPYMRNPLVPHYYSDDAIDEVEKEFGTLNELQKEVVRKEGYRPDWYLDTKGIPTVGVGQTGPLGAVTPIEAINQKINEVRNISRVFDTVPLDTQKALLDAHYRGDTQGLSRSGNWTTYEWVDKYSDYVEAQQENPRDSTVELLRQDAYKEVWDNEDYIQRMARIQAGVPESGDVGIMTNRVQVWMNELFGENYPPPSIQTKIDDLAATL